MQRKYVVLHLLFIAKHILFIRTVAKLYVVVEKVLLFALVPINLSVLSFTIYFFHP